MKMHSKVFIGVDPDVEKNGVAIWEPETKELTLRNDRFFELYGFLYSYCGICGKPVLVVIEGGWLNQKSNWHNEYQGVSAAARVAKNTGANHQVGKLIVEMCQWLQLPYEVVRPQSSKIKSDVFAKITKYKGRTNQEQRDAAMLVFGR